MNKFFAMLALIWTLSATPALAQQFKVLAAAIPNKYHNDYAVVAKPGFERMARQHGFDLVWAWNASAFDAELSQYAAIVFLNTPGEELGADQRKKVEAYVRAGGGVVAVHRALIYTPQAWPWFERLIGRAFRIHPMVQTAAIDVLDRNFPATLELPQRWLWTDEWYEFEATHAPGLHDLLQVDESSYDPTLIWPGQKAEGMGKSHPVAWYHAYDGGRVFVTALGHTPELYNDPRYLQHLYGGIWWAATGRGIRKDAAGH
ncbi:MAG: ThuA domain-containing protein [Pseudoxanthomonas sp.]